MEKMKRLSVLLKQEGKTEEDTIKWAYYGYGFLNCEGECKIKDLPADVKYSKCFKTERETYKYDEDTNQMIAVTEKCYCVDGAL